MKFTWKSKSSIDECMAFISGDSLFVKREHDGKWSCFSRFCGWQTGVDDVVMAQYMAASKKFFKGDTLEWVF